MAEKLERRGADILNAALRLLASGGTQALTTNALAHEAGCSKKTIYTLFNDRDALLAALVSKQSQDLNALLLSVDTELEAGAALTRAGAKLLELLTSEPSLVINRAALGDASGTLSRILVETGKNRSAPMFVRLLNRLREAGKVSFTDAGEAYAIFYGLLIADRQILALHRVELLPLDDNARLKIASRAVKGLIAVLAP